MPGDLTVTQEGYVRWLTMNRPEARNAIRATTIDDFVAALDDSSRDDSVRALVVTGDGPAFSAGGDVKEMGKLLETGIPDPPFGRRMVRNFHRMIAAMYDIEKPVIAAVNGPAFGAGCNVALCADTRLAADTASFCWAFVQRGLVTDAGSTFLLQQLVGYSRAMELLCLGETVDAEEARRLGLVRDVVAPEKLREEAQKLAEQFAQGPPNAIAMIKRALQTAATLSLVDALEVEAGLQAVAFGGAEFREGVLSFLEKRPPKF
jgi:2-(1,2-epoxy-1,2-dihydrophenyl)acetyl-CoA isomerase